MIDFKLNNPQKAALFLLALPHRTTSRLVNDLSSLEIRIITREMRQLTLIPPEARITVMLEFQELLAKDPQYTLTKPPSLGDVLELAEELPLVVMSILRRHWLVTMPPELSQGIVAKAPSHQQAAVFTLHLPSNLLKRIMHQLSPSEVTKLAEGMIQVTSMPEESKNQIWNQTSRYIRGNIEDQDSILKIMHTLLREEPCAEGIASLNYFEKTALILKTLDPKECSVVGQRLFNLLKRPQQEGLILALKQKTEHPQPKCEEGLINAVIQEFLIYLKCSSVSENPLSEEELIEEIERVSLRTPYQVSQCLESEWLSPKNPILSWKDLAAKYPDLAASKLSTYVKQDSTCCNSLTDLQKGGLLLRIMHPEIRTEVLKHLHNPDTLMNEIEHSCKISKEEKRKILEEFRAHYYFLVTSRVLEKNN